MSKEILTAACRFCGQTMQLDDGGELTPQAAEEQATMLCGCTNGVTYRTEKKRRERALKNVSALFGEDAPEEKRVRESILDIMRAAVEVICAYRMEKVTLNMPGGGKSSHIAKQQR